MNPPRRAYVMPVLLEVLFFVPALALLLWIPGTQNPYEKDGLRMEWSYGATSTVPTVVVYAEDPAGRVEAPIAFHGLEDPSLRYYDFDRDGAKDIVFSSEGRFQVLGFEPRKGGSLPRFQVIRNDVNYP